MIKKTCLYLSILLVLLMAGCENAEKPPLQIAISKAIPEQSYIAYINWLKTFDSTVVIHEMYHLSVDSALLLLEQCNGLLLTGGTDIYPGEYGKAFDTIRCWPIDFKRDSVEFGLIKKALEMQLPILGICRGEQILNVSQGGSLYVDLPEDLGDGVTHQCEDKTKCFHDVSIKEGSLLHSIAGQLSGSVNSNHHQGIHVLAEGFRAVAHTNDGLTEAIEWADPKSKGFLLAVQWHPERMDLQNPLSGKIGEKFIVECKVYCQSQKCN